MDLESKLNCSSTVSPRFLLPISVTCQWNVCKKTNRHQLLKCAFCWYRSNLVSVVHWAKNTYFYNFVLLGSILERKRECVRERKRERERKRKNETSSQYIPMLAGSCMFVMHFNDRQFVGVKLLFLFMHIQTLNLSPLWYKDIRSFELTYISLLYQKRTIGLLACILLHSH